MADGETTDTELAIIGAGPGGYVAAIRAAQYDLDVTLVERDAFGGTCLNTGCIPSKAYITATDIAHEASNAELMGVSANPEVDLETMTEWKDGVVDQLTGGVEKLCQANGVNLVEGTARFVDDHTLRVDGADVESIAFDNAIIATGSRPIEIPGFSYADEPVWSSTDALAATEIPDRLVVVGGGYIGMELSTVYAKLGTEVMVVEMLDDILPQYGPDITRIIRSRAEDLGIEFNFGEGASEWTETDDGIVVESETEAGESSTYEADNVLVAVGRAPVTDTLDLGEAGIETTDSGTIPTDDRMRTDVDHIFAIGDVAGDPMLAHAASKEGIVAAEVAAGEPAAMDVQAIPAAVFTDPEIGTVGMSVSEAEEAGFEPVVGEMPFRASGRALTTGHTDGFVKIVADEESGFVLGGQIVGPEASELVAEVTLAIELGATLEDVASTVHTHPTLAEAVMEAAENAAGQAIHTMNS
ncbi:dihydrolipoyl dehydrogenase [Halohasta salina]|uniref:dihydrolipoyl dehydrogenase n=1 Tax=Halohasta salina TaxID=2961621 RepID=UPI0020A3C6FC|nr:dihydrolipoyl dehydrogenase [Halohasta salina]